MRTPATVICLVILAARPCLAGWFDTLVRVVTPPPSNAPAATTGAPQPVASDNRASLSEQDVASALKEALGKGVNRAVGQLGRDGGFLTNLAVRIPMPAELERIELGLRMAKQDKYADDFVNTMNHAAEKAVVEAAPVFADAVKAMTWQDALGILRGGVPDAATQYLRRTAGTELEKRFLPVVRSATATVGVAGAYKALRSAAPKSVTSFLGTDTFDVDVYVTRKATDGLFQMVAAEEQRIRADPVARTSDLLRNVFGAVAGAK